MISWILTENKVFTITFLYLENSKIAVDEVDSVGLKEEPVTGYLGH
jgi:hypothetical protein